MSIIILQRTSTSPMGDVQKRFKRGKRKGGGKGKNHSPLRTQKLKEELITMDKEENVSRAQMKEKKRKRSKWSRRNRNKT